MKIKIPFWLALLASLSLIVLWLASCNSVNYTSIEITPTSSEPRTTVKQTPSTTPTIRASFTPRPTWTVRPPTLTPTPTSTYIPFPSSTPLSMLMLSIEDIQVGFEQDDRSAFYIYFSFIDTGGGTLDVVDRSYDLQSSCLIECTRQIWVNSLNSLIITMIRTRDEEAAKITALDLYDSLKPYHYEYEEEMYLGWVNAPIENTHIGFSTWNRKFTLTTSVGPIALKLEILIPRSDDTPIDILVAFANLQIKKLQEANVVP